MGLRRPAVVGTGTGLRCRRDSCPNAGRRGTTASLPLPPLCRPDHTSQMDSLSDQNLKTLNIYFIQNNLLAQQPPPANREIQEFSPHLPNAENANIPSSQSKFPYCLIRQLVDWNKKDVKVKLTECQSFSAVSRHLFNGNFFTGIPFRR